MKNLLFLLCVMTINIGHSQQVLVIDSQDSLYLEMYNMLIHDIDKQYNCWRRDILLIKLFQGNNCIAGEITFDIFNLNYVTYLGKSREKQKLLHYLQEYYQIIVESSVELKEFDFFLGRAEMLAVIDKKNNSKRKFLLGIGNIIKKSEKDYYILVNIAKKIVDNEQMKGITYYQHIEISAMGEIELKEKITMTFGFS